MNKESDIKYFHESTVHNLKAPGEIVPYLIKTFSPSTILDVGCGTGTFLHMFKQHGIEDITGLDGEWVEISKLHIGEKYFQSVNLEQSFDLNKKFDVVLCLEVVEHLDPSSAEIIIESLVRHGNLIVFSAALPGQGGQNHINEQSFAYWQKLFEKYDYYYVDLFRDKFWNNNNIDWWYSQNMFLVIKENEAHKRGIHLERKYFKDCFHPGCLNTHINLNHELKGNADAYSKVISGKLPFFFYCKQLIKKALKILRLYK